MAGWVPWKRMPSRYQRTRGPEPEMEPPPPPPTPRPVSARPSKSTPRSPRVTRRVSSAGQKARSQADPQMPDPYLHDPQQEEGGVSGEHKALPGRSSAYVFTRKLQLLLSSARRRDDLDTYRDTATVLASVSSKSHAHRPGTNQRHTATPTQRQKSSRQQDRITSPRQPAASPKEADSPRGPAESPRDADNPRQSAGAPGHVISPRQEATSPSQASTDQVSSPRRVTSPRQLVFSPRLVVTSPELVTSPRPPPPSPRQDITSPRRLIYSPGQNSSTLRQGVTSPRQEITSPRRAVTSPRQEVTSPRQEVTRQEAITSRQHIAIPEQELVTSSQDTGSEGVTSPRVVITPRQHAKGPGQVTNPRKHFTSPSQVTSPRRQVTSSRQVTSPRQQVTSSRQVTSPRQVNSPSEVRSPRQVTSPRHVSSPRQRISSSRMVTSPRQQIASPRQITTPRRQDASPRQVASPRQLSSSRQTVSSGRRGEETGGDRRGADGPWLYAEGNSPVLHPRTPTPQHRQVVSQGEPYATAVYMDKGRATFFKTTRNDASHPRYAGMATSHVTRDDGSYMAHLRKAYLSGARHLAKTNPHHQPDKEVQQMVRTRRDYEKKVKRILDYYSAVDVSTQLHSPRPPSDQHPVSAGGALPGRAPFKVTVPPRRQSRSARERRPSGKDSESLPSPRDASQQPAVQSDRVSPGRYVRISAQARLHRDFRFYLRTPSGICGGRKGKAEGAAVTENGAEIDTSCACRLCLLEGEAARAKHAYPDVTGVGLVPAPVIEGIPQDWLQLELWPGHPAGPVESTGASPVSSSECDGVAGRPPSGLSSVGVLDIGSTSDRPSSAEDGSDVIGFSAPAAVVTTTHDIDPSGHNDTLSRHEDFRSSWTLRQDDAGAMWKPGDSLASPYTDGDDDNDDVWTESDNEFIDEPPQRQNKATWTIGPIDDKVGHTPTSPDAHPTEHQSTDNTHGRSSRASDSVHSTHTAADSGDGSATDDRTTPERTEAEKLTDPLRHTATVISQPQ